MSRIFNGMFMKHLTLLLLSTTLFAVEIDYNKIIQIESSGRETATSRTGARGLMQIQKPTWGECTQGLDVKWDWSEAYEGRKNIVVGIYYLDHRIPQMLRYYKIPDTIETRITAYNWGIGNLLKCYRKHGRRWQQHLPNETKSYINKYHTLKDVPDYLKKYGVE